MPPSTCTSAAAARPGLRDSETVDLHRFRRVGLYPARRRLQLVERLEVDLRDVSRRRTIVQIGIVRAIRRVAQRPGAA